MQSSFANARVLHRREQHGMREKFAILDHQIDAGDVHVHDAARANIKMPNFAVAHLPFGQSDKRSTGVNQRVGILAQKAVIGGLTRQRDSVGFGLGAITPAVEDDKYQRFRTRHKCGFRLLARGEQTHTNAGVLPYCFGDAVFSSARFSSASTSASIRGYTAFIVSALTAGISWRYFCPAGEEKKADKASISVFVKCR